MLLVSGFCHFGLVLFMVLWQSPDTPIMSAFSCERAASSVLESRALSSAYIVLCGAWCLDRGTHVLSFGSCRGSDTRASFSVIVWVCGLGFARHRTLLSTCVLLCCTQFVFLSAACIYVISCAVWHAACIFIGCVLSCCHVWKAKWFRIRLVFTAVWLLKRRFHNAARR